MANKLEILKKLISDSVLEADLEKLFKWFNSEKGQNEISDELDKNWSSFVAEEDIEVDSNQIFTNVKREIERGKTFQLKTTLQRFLPYAAILVLALVSSFFIYSYFLNSTNNIYQSAYTSLVTENGQRSKVVLPDSSIAWINSGTTLSYLYNKEKKRSIILEGEAFFEVRNDKQNPFTVQANGVEVTVLGTRFGVESYPGSGKTSVVLESGSVEMSCGEPGGNIIQLKPGELGVYDLAAKSLDVGKTEVQNHISWKDNKLIFRDENMRNVITYLERWFNVEVEVEDPEVYNSIFTGTITNESYEQIFRLIEYSCPIKCEIETNNKSGLIPHITLHKK